jgi:3-oxoadipate CoA-transferase alpha subunit
MLDRRVPTYSAAVAGLRDGMTVMINGFGGAGVPLGLCRAVHDLGIRDLTIISNNAGSDQPDVSLLLAAGRVRKVICSYPRTAATRVFADLYAAGKVELEVIPQGTLVERMRCAMAGLGGVFTPTGADTELTAGKEHREIDGRRYVLELPLRADVALIKALRADRLGNLTYRKLARNFAPIMAGAAALTIVEADEVVEAGAIDPEHVITPGILVDRVVRKGAPA